MDPFVDMAMVAPKKMGDYLLHGTGAQSFTVLTGKGGKSGTTIRLTGGIDTSISRRGIPHIAWIKEGSTNQRVGPFPNDSRCLDVSIPEPSNGIIHVTFGSRDCRDANAFTISLNIIDQIASDLPGNKFTIELMSMNEEEDLLTHKDRTILKSYNYNHTGSGQRLGQWTRAAKDISGADMRQHASTMWTAKRDADDTNERFASYWERPSEYATKYDPTNANTRSGDEMDDKFAAYWKAERDRDDALDNKFAAHWEGERL